MLAKLSISACAANSGVDLHANNLDGGLHMSLAFSLSTSGPKSTKAIISALMRLRAAAGPPTTST